MSDAATSLAEAGRRPWDVVVVGAGVAGGVAAYTLARRGLAVLLVEKATFPRWKVCGCCLNPATLTVLADVGLGHIVEQCRAASIQTMRLAVSGRQVDLSLPGWRSLSRERLDAALAAEAVAAGVTFLQGTEAALGPVRPEGREVQLRRERDVETVVARLVLAADGLGGRLLAGEDGCETSVESASRVGAAAVLAGGPDWYRPGQLCMAYGRGGYVGVVRLEDGRLNVAAALDVDRLRAAHAPAAVAAALLEDVGWPAVPGLADCPWRGTPALTRRRALPAAERVLALGDAAGYLEPFTGEGIGWAAASAVALVPFAERAVRSWQHDLTDQWGQCQRRGARRRQRFCHAITWLTRHPRLARGVVELLAWMPWLAQPLVGQMRAGSLS